MYRFDRPEVVAAVVECIKGNYHTFMPTWKKVDNDTKTAMFNHFKVFVCVLKLLLSNLVTKECFKLKYNNLSFLFYCFVASSLWLLQGGGRYGSRSFCKEGWRAA